jgi:hypothetical protein
LEAGVPRGEVKFLVKTGVIWNVHFTIGTQNLPIWPKDYGGVVIQASCPLFKQARDEGNLVFLGRGRKKLGCGSWNRLGQLKTFVVLLLAEVERSEELGKTDKLGATAGCLRYMAKRGLNVSSWISYAGHLNQSYR